MVNKNIDFNINIFCFEGTNAHSEKKIFRTLESNEIKTDSPSWKVLMKGQKIAKISTFTLKIQKSHIKNFSSLKAKINQAISTTKTSLKDYFNLFCILIDRDVKDKENLLYSFLKENKKAIIKLLPKNSNLVVILYPDEHNLEYLIACLLEKKENLSSLTTQKAIDIIRHHGIDLEADIKSKKPINFLEKAHLKPIDAFSNLKANLVPHHFDESYQQEVKKINDDLGIEVISFAHLFNLCNKDNCH